MVIPWTTDPSIQKELSESFNSLCQRKVLSIFQEIGSAENLYSTAENISPDRKKLDQIVMTKILGLGEEDIIQAYESLIEIVQSRTTKAKSLQKGGKTKNGIDLNLLAQNVMNRLGVPNLATVYKEKIAGVPCQTIDLPKQAEPITIENTLFGWQVRVGKKKVYCDSENQARYLRLFAEMGWDYVLIPQDEKYLAIHY